MRNLLLFLSLLFSCCFAFAQNRGDIDYIQLLSEYEVEELPDFYENQYGYGFITGIVPPQNAIELYKIKYYTEDAGGVLTTATGLIAMPKGIDCTLPVAFYNHGTFYDYASMPSNLGFETLIGAILSTEGFISAIPDLIGYGDESPGSPNYIHAKTAGTANVDMMRAIKNWSEQQDSVDFTLNGQIFITGYSQGGHSAMAAHREFQQFHADEFTVTASAPGSGPYDVSVTQTNFMFDDDYYPQVAYIGIIILSYIEIYSDLVNMELFQENVLSPYDEIIIDILADFDTPLGVVNDQFPTNPFEMFDADYLNDFLTNPNHPLKIIFEDNNVYEWVPEAPMVMGFCTGDEEVSNDNARVAYNWMIENGAQNVDTLNLGNQSHFDCALPFLLNTRNMFNDMKAPCDGPAIAYNPLAKSELEIVHVTGSPFVYIHNHNAEAEALNIQLYDAQGRLMQEEKMYNYASYIRLDAPKNGLYHLVVTNNKDIMQSKKVVF